MQLQDLIDHGDPRAARHALEPGTIVFDHLTKLYRVNRGSVPIRQRFSRRKAEDAGTEEQPKEIRAVDDLTMVVPPGQVLGIIGPNGAGKSTLLKLLARVSPPTGGRVIYTGRLVSLLELGAGFDEDQTARENVFLLAAMSGVPREIAAKKMPDILKFAGVQKFADTPLKAYSSGMYVRLAFSAAINLEPRILLADEVLAVGDQEFQERCLNKVEELSKKGVTVLFVSHNMAAIRRLCDRVIWLDHGQVMAEGDARDVIGKYTEAMTDKADPGRSVLGTDRAGDGRIETVRLLSPGGEEIRTLQRSEEGVIELKVRVDKPKRNVRCTIALQAEGITAFTVTQPDTQWVSRGWFTATARIPANLLTDTMYTVKVMAELTPALKNPRPDQKQKPKLLFRENALTIRVYDTAGASPNGNSKAIEGVVRPELPWGIGVEPFPEGFDPNAQDTEEPDWAELQIAKVAGGGEASGRGDDDDDDDDDDGSTTRRR